ASNPDGGTRRRRAALRAETETKSEDDTERRQEPTGLSHDHHHANSFLPALASQRPRNTGARFSTNARIPSRASSVSKQAFWANVSNSSASRSPLSALR